MRSLTGPKNPDGPADPIIVHAGRAPHVADPEGLRRRVSRAFLSTYLAQLGDIVAQRGSEPEDASSAAEDLMALLTPIGKAFVTEVGYESANLGVQVYGGHGFIREWGMEQIVRDARIAHPVRGHHRHPGPGPARVARCSVQRRQAPAQLLQPLSTSSARRTATTNWRTRPIASVLKGYKDEWLELSMKIGESAMENPDEAGAAAVDYLMYSGYVTLAYFWARMAVLARQKIDAAEGDASFYEAKLMTAQFYFDRLLPRTLAHKQALLSGAGNLMQMPEAMFDF